MGHSPRNLPGAHERGVVMLVVLILLLLVTIVGFSVMEISSSQVKMAVNREGREVSFQGAESAIETVADDEQQLVD
ncbi:MAG: PilX N-terminal domain-containing pilus assembly protein, partial [Haliea sp.]|nr:PilX N-terminal domain-containing pilus assembly protein [Haliea sp.]